MKHLHECPHCAARYSVAVESSEAAAFCPVCGEPLSVEDYDNDDNDYGYDDDEDVDEEY